MYAYEYISKRIYAYIYIYINFPRLYTDIYIFVSVYVYNIYICTYTYM